jgi:hypothetical protein
MILVMEYFLENVLDITVCSGLRTESTEDEPFLDLDRILFNYLTSNEAINLLKLHGSLD